MICLSIGKTIFSIAIIDLPGSIFVVWQPVISVPLILPICDLLPSIPISYFSLRYSSFLFYFDLEITNQDLMRMLLDPSQKKAMETIQSITT
jgi:hypothetical protein